jgi:hypothetical protein
LGQSEAVLSDELLRFRLLPESAVAWSSKPRIDSSSDLVQSASSTKGKQVLMSNSSLHL